MSAGQLARHRSTSSGTRPPARSATATPLNFRNSDLEFEPCAATASIFLFTQDASILCLHHDTLAIERRFEKHKEQILFLSVDNVSERGAGRLVVSYDAAQTAIVWDLFTGDEIARFASYEQILVAAWMKNGNVAFGTYSDVKIKRGKLMGDRQCARKCYSLRTIYLGTHIGAHNLRSYNSSSPCFGLSNLCNWVSVKRTW